MRWGCCACFVRRWFGKWTEQWKSYRADEPSELYRFGVRFGGALFLVFGVVLPLLPLLLK